MKKLFTAALTISAALSTSLSTIPAFAQGESTSSPGKTQYKSEQMNFSGVSLMLGLSTASDIEAKNVSNKNSNDSAEIKYGTSSAPALSIGYLMLNDKSVGFSAALSHEFKREIRNAQIKDVGTIEGTNTPTFSFTSMEANINYSVNNPLYLTGGLNYPISVQTSDFANGVSMSGQLGGQGGFGFLIGKTVNIEALYKTTNFKMSTDKTETEYARLWGALLRIGIALQ